MVSGAVFGIFIVIAIVAIVFLGNYRLRNMLPQAAVTVTTLFYLPYSQQQTRIQPRHYFVVARQYSFSLPTAEPLGTPIIFDVTSADVNHGFGI